MHFDIAYHIFIPFFRGLDPNIQGQMGGQLVEEQYAVFSNVIQLSYLSLAEPTKQLLQRSNNILNVLDR